MILELWCVLYLHEHLKCLVSVKGVFPEPVFVNVKSPGIDSEESILLA